MKCVNTNIRTGNYTAKTEALKSFARNLTPRDKGVVSEEFVGSFLKVLDYIHSEDADDSVDKARYIKNTATDYVKNHTEYEDIKSLMGETDAGKKAHYMKRIADASEMDLWQIASFNKNPRKAFSTLELSKDWGNTIDSISGLIKRGNFGTLLFSGKHLGVKGYALINRGNIYKQHQDVLNMEIKTEELNTYTRAYFSLAQKALDKMVDVSFSHIKDNYKGEIPVTKTDLRKWLKTFDARAKTPIEDILSNKGVYKQEDQEVIIQALKVLNEDFQRFNYGDTLDNIDRNNFDARDKKYQQGDQLYQLDGKPVPAFLNFISNSGNELKGIIGDNNRVNPLHQSEKKVLEWFNETGFKPRFDNYIPLGYENTLRAMTSSSEVKGLFGGVDFLEHAKVKQEVDYESDFVNDFLKDAQSYQHMVSRVSEYSGNQSKLGAIDNDPRFRENNPAAYDALKYEGEHLTKQYEGDANNTDQISSGLASFKRFSTATISAAATSILAGAGPVNLAAGMMGIALRLGVKNTATMWKDYNSALSANNQKGHIARTVDAKMQFLGTKVDDMVKAEHRADLLEGKNAFEKGLDLATVALGKYTDFNVSKGIFGLIPGLKWLSFNETEGKINKINNILLFDKVNERMEMLSKRDGIEQGSDAFNAELDKSIEMFKGLAYTKSKEAVGYFGRNHKPFWAWQKLRDAKTTSAVIIGSLMTMSYVFKQVHFVNSHLMSRMASTFMSAGKKGSNAMPAASMGITMGVAGLMLYDWLSEQEELNLPTIGMARSLNPGSFHIESGRALKDMLDIVFNDKPMSEDEAENKLGAIGSVINKSKSNEELIENIFHYFSKLIGISNIRISSDAEDTVKPFSLEGFFDSLDASKEFVTVLANPTGYLGDADEWDKKAKLYDSLKEMGRVPIIGSITGISNDNLKAVADISTGLSSMMNFVMNGSKQNFDDAYTHTVGRFGSMVFGSAYINKKSPANHSYKKSKVQQTGNRINEYLELAPPKFQGFGNAAIEANREYNNPQKPISNMHKILRIIDGDTFEIELDGKLQSIRIMDLDTPESRFSDKALKQAEEWGQPVDKILERGMAAKKALMDKILNKTVRLDLQGRGTYKRPLARVYLADGENVGRYMMNMNLAIKFGSKETLED